MRLDRQLRALGACSEAVKWAKGRKLAEAWEACSRADWMLWLCGKMVAKKGWPTRQELILAACDCAETALPYASKGDERPATAIATARRWVAGKATEKEVADAADDAYAAYAAAYAAASSSAAFASVSAYTAAYAAAYAAAASSSARTKHLAKLAGLVRKRLYVGQWPKGKT